MTNEPTPAERSLATQAAQLQTQAAAQTRGGFWDVVGQIIPAPVLIAAVVVFGGFEGFKYWQSIQQSEAQSRIKDADKALAVIEAETLNRKADNGDTLALAKAKAELDKAQAEAARAKVEADAVNTKVGDASLRLEQLKAELAAKSAKAATTRLEARAALDRTGLLTLEQRAARAKLKLTELEAAKEHLSAALSSNRPANFSDPEDQRIAAAATLLKAYCNDNSFAREAGCPPEFITQEPPKIQTPLEAALERATSAPPPVTAPNRSSAEASPASVAVVNTLNLTLRSCPHATNDCPRVMLLPEGTRVRLLGDVDENGWREIEVALQGGGTQKGYVNGKFLALRGASAR